MKKVFLVLATAWLGLSCLSGGAKGADDFDLFFVVDRSGSIAKNDANCKKLSGKTCWILFNDFIKDVIDEVVELAGGLREEIQGTGVRVGIYSFGCTQLKPDYETFALTGSRAQLDANLADLRLLTPFGGTCPGKAMEDVRDVIQAKRTDEDIEVPTAVFMITDGLFEDGSRPGDAANAMRALSAEVFALQIGELVKKQTSPFIKEKTLLGQKRLQAKQMMATAGCSSDGIKSNSQVKKIKEVTAECDRFFGVEKASDLETIVDILAAMLLSDFTASFGDGVQEYCLGSTPPIEIGGPSVQFLSLDSPDRDILCALYRAGSYVGITTGSRVGDVVECDTSTLLSPLQFEDIQGSKETYTDLSVRVYLRIQTRERQIAEKSIPTITLSRCLDGAVTNSCVGNERDVVFTGQTVEFLRSSIAANSKLKIRCDLGGKATISAAVSESSITCSFEQPTHASQYDYVRVTAADGSKSAFVVAEVGKSALKRNFCVDTVDRQTGLETPPLICWSQPAAVYLKGFSLDWALSNGLTPTCTVDSQTLPSKIISLTGGGSAMECTLPSRFSQVQGERVTRTAAVELGIFSDNVPLVKSIEVTADPCIDISYDDQTCLGAPVELTFSGAYLEQFPGLNDIECTFQDMNSLALATASASYDAATKKASCSSPGKTGKWRGARFGPFELKTKQNLILKTNLDTGDLVKVKPCFTVVTSGSVPCAGSLDGDFHIGISGRSTQGLDDGELVCTLVAYDALGVSAALPSDIRIPATRNPSGDGMICDLPRSLTIPGVTSRTEFSMHMDIFYKFGSSPLEKVWNASSLFNLNPDACFFAEVVSVDGECWGKTKTFKLSGDSTTDNNTRIRTLKYGDSATWPSTGLEFEATRSGSRFDAYLTPDVTAPRNLRSAESLPLSIALKGEGERQFQYTFPGVAEDFNTKLCVDAPVHTPDFECVQSKIPVKFTGVSAGWIASMGNSWCEFTRKDGTTIERPAHSSSDGKDEFTCFAPSWDFTQIDIIAAGLTVPSPALTEYTKVTLKYNGNVLMETPAGFFDNIAWKMCWFDDDVKGGSVSERNSSAVTQGSCPGEPWALRMNGPTAMSVKELGETGFGADFKLDCKWVCDSPPCAAKKEKTTAGSDFACSDTKNDVTFSDRYADPVVTFTLAVSSNSVPTQTFEVDFRPMKYAEKHEDRDGADACLRNTQDSCAAFDGRTPDTTVTLVGRTIDAMGLLKPENRGCTFRNAENATTVPGTMEDSSSALTCTGTEYDYTNVDVVTLPDDFSAGGVALPEELTECYSKYLQWIIDNQPGDDNIGIIIGSVAGGLLFLLAAIFLVGRRKRDDDVALKDSDLEIGGGDGEKSEAVMIPNPIADKGKGPKKEEEIELPAVNDAPAEDMSDVWRAPVRQHKPMSGDAPEGTKPYRLRFKKRKPLGFRELPGNQFEVTLDMTDGLGLSLGWTTDSRVIVAGFKDLPNGDWGPVEACGLVGLKDQLLRVNDESIGGTSFVEVSRMIQQSGKTIKLRFGRWTDKKISIVPKGQRPKSVSVLSPETRKKLGASSELAEQ